ncbi:MAG: 2-amino-4-hydroxy-6-hydroxymethyldihydropteridine diphosphokinase [Deltaproteobacteria bacterium]|nr:2-amino-4-hydroxy-6-hydroxymethyldihydropteridine diphosphokinase [Deltaproteobacteria bacterium]
MRVGGERAFVALGANLGDCEATFSAVIEAFEREPDLRLIAASGVYETPPLGPPGQDPYLNAVVSLHVWLSPYELLACLQAIESGLGRDRGPDAVRWGPRAIDLDLLFFGDRCVTLPDLEVPHPRLHERAFVLVPLADLAPALVHPVRGGTVEAMLAAQEGVDDIVPRARPAGWPGAR